MNKERIAFIIFNHLFSFSFQRYQRFIKYFSKLSSALEASVDDFIFSGLESELARKLKKDIQNFNLSSVLKLIDRENIRICCFNDNDYPFLLKNIYSPPPIFYYKGNLKIDWTSSLSVVGSRRISSYGRKNIDDFITPLASYGINIVSGLAIGADSLAHQVILDKQGLAVAVLGSGVDNKSIYPRQNFSLAQQIIEKGGLILSEFYPRSEIFLHNFPQRNRIIAGLSKAVLIVEASEKSGSLITAHHSLNEGREVLSFPGSLSFPNYVGNNNLIKSGAILVNNINDILNIFQIQTSSSVDKKKQSYQAKNKIEKHIINNLKKGLSSITDLEKDMPGSSAELGAALSILEIEGIIKDSGFKNYFLI